MASQRSRVLTADGTELHAEAAGHGPSVLLIQGLGYATWGWSRTIPSLAVGFRVIAFDNRGWVRSHSPDEPYAVALMSDDALSVLETLGEQPAHVVGFSLGGYIALMLAQRHPAAVASLALLSTSCGGPGTFGVPRATRAAWEAASTLDPREYARKTMPLSFAPGWTKEHPDEFEELLEMRLPYPTPSFSWRHQLEAGERFLEQGIDPETVTQPALVIHGTRDRVVPFANGKRLAARLPNATLMRLEGAGHLALLEQPGDVNDAIVRFLS
jgi:pimeloyl-ACP methyl ester carboxylesterase